MCVSACRYVNVSVGVHGDQNRALDPVELEPEVGVGNPAQAFSESR